VRHSSAWAPANQTYRPADLPLFPLSVRSIFQTATKDLGRIRNLQRVQASMKM
jgi:hypothetical protein